MTPTEAEKLARIRGLIADDAYAASFQTFGQYRSALLKSLGTALNASLSAPAEAPASTADGFPPLPGLLHSGLGHAITDWESAEDGDEAGVAFECMVSAYADQMHAYVLADRAARGVAVEAVGEPVPPLTLERALFGSDCERARALAAPASPAVAEKVEREPVAMGSVLQRVMARLADMLDDDQFNNIQAIVEGAGYTAPAAQPVAPVVKAQAGGEALSKAAFTAWAETEYRNADEYTRHDYDMGLAAWQAALRTEGSAHG